MVKPPVMATSLQRPLFWQIAHKLYFDYHLNLSKTATFSVPKVAVVEGFNCIVKFTDQFRFLGNCPPTPPLSQHFALIKK